MFYNIYPQKDTTIYNVRFNGTLISSSNAGYSEIIELLHLTTSFGSAGDSRILMYFDLTTLSESIASGLIPSASVEYRLQLKNAVHQDEVPSSFDIKVMPISSSWDEGRGLSNYDDGLKDRSQYATWIKRTSALAWTISGGDTINSFTASQYFDSGFENLDVDISTLVVNWISGTIPNHGLMIRFPDSYESGTVDYAFKKFFARNAKVPERRPCISARWKKVVQDDRANTHFNLSSSLYYYRYIDGDAQNQAQMYVRIQDFSGSLLQTLTASRPQGTNGIYSASNVGIAPTTASAVCKDIWFSGATQYFTGTFNLNYSSGSKSYDYDDLVVEIPNIKSYYIADEKINFKVFIREKDYKPAVLSIANAQPKPVFVKNAYYEIVNEKTNEVFIAFSTGSTKYSQLSYDQNGNYFELWTNSLPSDNIYRIKILINYNDKQLIFDEDWKINIR